VAFKKKLLLLNLLFSFNSFGAAWISNNTWNDSFEAKYQEWVKKEWRADIFTNSSLRVYNLDRTKSIDMSNYKTDCADAAYLMRGLFSYLHSLPYKIKMDFDPENKNSNVSSSSSKDACGFSSFCWNNISNADSKFKMFMQYVQTMRTNTTTLANDTYSPVVSSTGVTAGNACLLYKYHSYQIQSINDQGVPTKTNSTVPYQVRDLAVSTGFCTHDTAQMPNGGIRKWRTPENLYASKATLIASGLYSEDQYTMSDAQISSAIRTGAEESIAQKDQRLLNDLTTYVNERITMIKDAYQFCVASNNDCNSSSNFTNWDNWSTPSRDGRLLGMYKEWIKTRNQRTGVSTAKTVLEGTSVNIKTNVSTNLYSFFKVLNGGDETVEMNNTEDQNKLRVKNVSKFLTEPENTIERRWGL
jgi:hypothetical protein